VRLGEEHVVCRAAGMDLPAAGGDGRPEPHRAPAVGGADEDPVAVGDDPDGSRAAPVPSGRRVETCTSWGAVTARAVSVVRVFMSAPVAPRQTARTRPRAGSLRARDAQGGARPGPSCQSSRSRMASDTRGCHRWSPAHAERSSRIWSSPRSWNVLGRHSGQHPTAPAPAMAHAVCGEQEGPALIGGDGRGPFAVPASSAVPPRSAVRDRSAVPPRSAGPPSGLEDGRWDRRRATASCGCAPWCRPRPT
jgi:hypothetical protein